MERAGALQAVVGAALDGHEVEVVRDGSAHGWPVSPQLRRRDGLLRPLCRGRAEREDRVDERGRRRCGTGDDGDVRGERWPDGARGARVVSVEGGARRGRDRSAGGDARNVPAARRTPRDDRRYGFVIIKRIIERTTSHADLVGLAVSK